MIMRIIFCFVFMLSCSIVSIAQGKDQGDGKGAGSFPFAGNTYRPSDLPDAYPRMKSQRVIWYKLVQVESPATSSQPLALVPLSCSDTNYLPPEARQDAGLAKACQNPGSNRWYAPSFPDRRNPLRDGDHLVIAIADPFNLIAGGHPKIELLTINVVAASASPLNPSPLRPATSAPGGGAPGGPATKELAAAPSGKVYYLPWSQALTGDAVPTVTITALYGTPSPQSASPKPKTDTGKEAPAATDQAVVVLSTTLPQVHSMYAYNLSFGVIASKVREPSFTRVANAAPCPTGVSAPGSSTSPCGTYTDSASSPHAVEPAVFFTTYVPQRFDAESKWHPLETVWPIAPSVGISLTQPSTDFFFGNSSEVRRGVQVVYGWHLARTNYLLPGENPTSSAASPTGRHFKSGAFIGVTFNLNFVQSLFPGGGGK